MDIYAVFNVEDPPKKLKLSESDNEFYFYFPPPLPSYIILFAINNQDSKSESIYQVRLHIDNAIDEKELGVLTNKNSAICWNGSWTKEEVDCAKTVLDAGRVLKLVVLKEAEAEVNNENFSSQDVLLNDKKQSKKQKNTVSSETEQKVNDNLTADQEFEEFQKSFDKFEEEFQENQNKLKKLHRSITSKKSPANKRDLKKKESTNKAINKENINNEPLDPFELPTDENITNELKVNKTTLGKRSSPFVSLSEKKKKTCNEIETPNSKNKSKRSLRTPKNKISTPTRFSDLLHEHSPSSRWGHAFCSINDGRAVLLGGQGPRQQMSSDSLWLYDTATKEWLKENTDNPSIDRRMGHSVCYDDQSKTMYVYGGSKHKKWYNDVHCLDVDTWKWTKIETVGKAPTRAYHSCTCLYDELLIFGGVYPNPDPTPDGCSDELLIFDKEKKSWYTPIVNGDVPSARSGHSACLLDGLLYIFGGWDAPTCYNDMFVLDLGIMKFSKVTCIGKIPSERTWHSTNILSDRKRICIYGGFNGEDPLKDIFLFNTSTSCWSTIHSSLLAKRTGHSSILVQLEENNDVKDSIVVFGGGDNNGNFFDDIIELPVDD